MRNSQKDRGAKNRDEGVALTFAMVFIVIGSFMIMPLLDYVTTVLRSSKVQQHKADRAEAVRGALRVALADPSTLYSTCSDSGLHTQVQLAAPDLGVPVTMHCTTLTDAAELDDVDLRVPMATVRAGAVAPVGTVGTPYANNGSADIQLWWNDVTSVSEGGKIFYPPLPSHGLNHGAANGYMMPAWAGSCRVYFPGTYTDPISIADTIPTFFTSGVYYFENTVTFGPGANVVVGEGAIEACTTNSDAAFYAIGAPFSINISGIGATFVFGAAGRMVVTDNGAATGPSVLFNVRLVDPTDVGNTVSSGVSIETVNGVENGPTASLDLYVAGELAVSKSLTETNLGDADPPVDAASTGYRPSTLVRTIAAPAVPAVIDIVLTGPGATTLYVPGYTQTAQGVVNVFVAPGQAANKSIQLIGGVLAAQITQSPDLPADNQLGIVNRVVQKTFKIIATTTSGTPVVSSIAIVQVNDYGEFAINSWVTTTVISG